jgi:hypothetical protein
MRLRRTPVTMNRLFLRGIVVGFFLCLTGSLAFGQSNRTFVSGVGDDTNAATPTFCSRIAPCKTFAVAIGVTNAEGEIDVLDPGGDANTPGSGAGFGAVTITKSISIVAGGGQGQVQQSNIGGILVTSGNAITVSAGSTDVVVLRGLTLDGFSGGGAVAIQFTSGAELHVEDCAINSFVTGINVASSAASQIFIKNTVVRNNTGNAIEVVPSGGQSQAFIQDTIVGNNGGKGILLSPSGSATVTASFDRVRLEGNNGGLKADDGTNVSVRNSVVAGNGGGLGTSSGARAAVINLESSIVSGNVNGIASVGANSTINLSDVMVVNNSVGLSSSGGGHIVSFGDNKITNNTTNGSPTQTISQK